MQQKKHFKSTIGIVLSAVPKYSETFFRSKIKGLQDNGHEVIIFVDYYNKKEDRFPCKIVASPRFDKSLFSKVKNGLVSILKTIFMHPVRSITLFKLDKKDGVSLKKRLKNLIVNQSLLSQNLDWLHFGFGMFVMNRENIAEAIGAKMAVSFRGSDLYLSPLLHKNCYDLLFKKELKYHVLSQEMKQDLMDNKIPEKNIKVINPAIDITFFKTEKDIIKRDVFQLITVARLHWKKGFVYTLEALAILKRKGINFHYTIIGEGIQKERLMFAAHQLGILKHITFTGKQKRDAIKKHLEQSTIYLQYSIQEGFCNAVLEAQAMGLLCVVSDAEGLNENIVHNKTGWVVPKRKPEALAKKIIAVMHLSEEEKATIKQAAIKRVQDEFNLEKQKVLFADFYTN